MKPRKPKKKPQVWTMREIARAWNKARFKATFGLGMWKVSMSADDLKIELLDLKARKK